MVTQIHQLLLTIKATATLEDAYMFLFVIDGAMVQLLSKDRIDERDKLLDYFLIMMS
ncbi:putative transcriptional regulator [Acinetobacter baumannii 1417041]|nr:putative transcriptional regulator [Acinetobacter baumannii 1417041]